MSDIDSPQAAGEEDGKKKSRVSESSKKLIAEDAQKVIAQQRYMIDVLKGENTNLKQELSLESKNENIVPTKDQAERISMLQEQADTFTKRIEAERRTVEVLQRQMATIESRTTDVRKKTGGIHRARDASLQYVRQVKVLENRLEKSVIKLNEALQLNKELREQIDNLRRERLNYHDIYKKVEKELQERKREMASIIEISNIAYEARDQAQNEIAALRAQADREQAAFEHEMAELNAMLEQDLKAQEAERQKALLMTDPNLIPDLPQPGSARRTDGKGGRRTSFLNAGTGQDRRSSYRNLAGIEDVFNTISEVTGITAIDELVDHFINMEDFNFKLFEHNQSLNSEIEQLQEQMDKFSGEHDRMKGSTSGSAGDNRKELLRDLDERALKNSEKEAGLRAKTQSMQTQLGKLKEQLQTMFDKLGCETADVKAHYAEILSQGITDSSMVQFMGIVEKRASDILLLYRAKKEGGDLPTGAGGGKDAAHHAAAAPARHDPLEILPPSTTRDPMEDDEEDDHVDRPLTRNEIKVSVARANRTAPVKERSGNNAAGRPRQAVPVKK